MPTLLFYSSAYASLALADAAASGAGGSLAIDSNIALSANTTLTTKQISFDGGLITLGTYDLTFTGNAIVAGGVRIFDSTGSGKVKGTIDGSLCIDWWGTTSTSVGDPATKNAGNDCFAYIVQSDNPRAELVFTKANYYLSDSWVKPESFYCPQIEGRGAILNYAFGSGGKGALILVGGSGYVAVQGYVSGLTFSGDTAGIGLELRGQCGVTVKNCVFETNAVGLMLRNYSSGQFTEFCTWHDCVFRACRIWWYYARANGDRSFNGSGPDGNVVCNDSSPTAARIIADPDLDIYNCPLNFTAFPTSNSYPLISLGSGTKYLPNSGTIGIENAGYSGVITILTGGSLAAGIVSVSVWGSDFNLGDLVLMETLNIQIDGVIRGRRAPFQKYAAGTGVNTNITLQSGSFASSSYLLNVFVNKPNYFWKGTLQVTSDPYGGNAAAAVQGMLAGGVNYGSWGAPTFTWNGNALTVSNANFAANGTISVAATDLGDFF